MRIGTTIKLRPTIPTFAAPAQTVQPAQQPLDKITLSAPAQPINKAEMAERYTNNILLHLGLSDAPAVMAIAANYGSLPAALQPALHALNAVNAITSVAAVAADLRELRGTLKNSHATKLDVAMDLTHLVAGDMLSTAAGLVPVFTPLTNPWASGFFVGGQLLGMALDAVKTGYDFERKGQQSV